MSGDRDEATGRFLPGNSASGGAGGRPSAYRPEYCEAVIDFMADGYSVTAFAGSVRVSRQTIYQWAADHPEFSDALAIGKAAAALWWEGRLRNNAEKGEGNATAAIFGLKNRAAEEWREVNRTEHSGPDGGPIKTEATLDVSGLSDAALAELHAAMKNDGTDPA